MALIKSRDVRYLDSLLFYFLQLDLRRMPWRFVLFCLQKWKGGGGGVCGQFYFDQYRNSMSKKFALNLMCDGFTFILIRLFIIIAVSSP